MATFPKMLKKVEGAAIAQLNKDKGSAFQLNFKTSTFEAQIVVNSDSVFIISDNTF